MAKIDELLEKYEVNTIVIGMPYHAFPSKPATL